MVLFTGLWTNSGLFGLDSSAQQDEDDEGDHAPTLRTTNLNRTDGKNDTTILNHGFFQPPTDYGSTKDDTSMEEPSTNSHENNKAITWDAALFAPLDTNNAQNNNKNNLQDETASTSTTATLSDLELPSLSGAFQALENRHILIHCAYYLAIYFAVAIVAYSYVFERWTIIDSMYFAVATFTTCGYGDKEPTTTAGQLFTILFAIYGVIILGVFIGIFGNFISQTQTRALKKFHKRKQQQMLDTLFEAGEPPPVHESGFWSDHVSLADDVWKVMKAEFPVVLLVAVMAIFLGLREGWSFTSTLYFSIMAATTTGYGDYTPKTQIDKLYCLLFLPLAVAVFGEVLGRIATVYIHRKQRLAEAKFLHRSLTLCDLRNMDANADGAVDREEFVTFLLIALQKVDAPTIQRLRDIFDSLDTNGNGLLEPKDLMELAEESYVPTLQQVLQQQQQEAQDLQQARSFEFPLQPAKRQTLPHRRVHTVI